MASKREDEKSRCELETLKAEIEYNLRAAEYNVEILKNKNENLSTELDLMRSKHAKTKKVCRMLKEKCERNANDLNNYKQ